MKNLEISNEHRLLLESVIKENKNYALHKDLLDKFIEAIYKKSYLIIGAIKDMSRLRRHLLIIADSTMETVIKEQKEFEDNKLIKKIQESSIKNKDIVSLRKNLDDKYKLTKQNEAKQIMDLKEEIQKSEGFGSINELNDPSEGIIEKEIPLDILDKLVHIVKIIDLKHKDKNYYKIFILRYVKKYPQSQIARTLNISQVELSKRYVDLIGLVKESLFKNLSS